MFVFTFDLIRWSDRFNFFTFRRYNFPTLLWHRSIWEYLSKFDHIPKTSYQTVVYPLVSNKYRVQWFSGWLFPTGPFTTPQNQEEWRKNTREGEVPSVLNEFTTVSNSVTMKRYRAVSKWWVLFIKKKGIDRTQMYTLGSGELTSENTVIVSFTPLLVRLTGTLNPMSPDLRSRTGWRLSVPYGLSGGGVH